MFFVGLAGPFLPYILFTGVMLVFTLGANSDVLRKIALPQPENEFVLDSGSDNIQNTETGIQTADYHWSFGTDQPVPDQTGTDCKPSVLPRYPDHTKTLHPPIREHYSSAYCASYFGLSPPQLA